MAANVYQPHLLLLIEDDANRQIFNGFDSHPAVAHRRIDPSKTAGGWHAVLDAFRDVHIALLRRYPLRHLLMVIDFDSDEAGDATSRIDRRLDLFREAIPDDLRDRVYVIGCADEPEELVKSTGHKFEEIGQRLARDCADDTEAMWGHPMLRHNGDELARLRTHVRPFFFR